MSENSVSKRLLLFLRGTCRCSVRRICITSKSALLLQFCTFVMFMVLYHTIPGVTVEFVSFLYYSGVTSYIPPEKQPYLQLTVSALSALIFILFPIGGYCGDVKWGRYRVVKHSLCASLVLLVVAMPVGIMLSALFAYHTRYLSVLMSLIGLSAITCVGVMFIMGHICFAANVIQFGIDQLLDSPSHHQSLFIHWFVWVLYISSFATQIVQIAVSLLGASGHINIIVVTAVFIVTIVLFSVLYCLVRYKQQWFLIEPGQVNPYKLVYEVTDFARKHRTPVYRSAFTYCEDEWPSRLDLGKEKYGGMFKTEEVEDVKTFYGMLKVLLALGPVFFLRVATNTTSPLFHPHTDNEPGVQSVFSAILHGNTLFTPLLVIVSIPLYLCALRSYLTLYLPRMLNRIAIGILMDVMVIVSKLMLNIITLLNRLHSDKEACGNESCEAPEAPFYLEAPFLVIEVVLSALSSMLIYAALYEFICSQSPNAMKGMLIGLSYTVKGIFQLMGTLAILPFLLWNNSIPDRAFGYYLFNLVVGISCLIVYVVIARRYKYRIRDEPSREWEYAEAYYSTTPELADSIFQ